MTRALEGKAMHQFRKAPASVTGICKSRKFEIRADYAKGDPWLLETRPSDDD